LELHFTLDFYSVYEFHLTLLGSPRELTAQATVHPLDLYSKYEFHFTLRSYLFSAPGLLLRERLVFAARLSSLTKQLTLTRP